MHKAIGKKIAVEFSARHIHLSQKDQDALFGAGYAMTVKKELSQRGQFAYEEKVMVRGKDGELSLRVLGPCRDATQVELAASDARQIGVSAPVRLSGNVHGSGKATLVGPQGTVELREGVINDVRHVHMSPSEAEGFELRDGDTVDIALPGKTPITVRNVAVRVREMFEARVHIDVDEANAAGIETQGEFGEIVAVNGTI